MEIADALTVSGDGWREMLERVPEYDRERTEFIRERIMRTSWAAAMSGDGAYLKDGTAEVERA